MNSSPFALIVEDNILLANMFSRALTDIRYQAQVIADGKTALDWLAYNVPDIILLDMHLPLISGEVILKSIYQNPRFANTHTLIVTADARMGETFADQADFLLNKPIDIHQLQQMADRLKPKYPQKSNTNQLLTSS